MKFSILVLAAILSFCGVEAHTYYGQYQQDKLINEAFFQDMQGGVFIDIGAHNGVTFNNTLFFEKDLGWTGLCIEPIPEVFQQLSANRKCKCVQGCISNSAKHQLFFRAATPAINSEMLSGLVKTYDPIHYQRLVTEVAQTGGQLQVLTVNCFVLNDLLKHNNINHVNYLSIDTEGSEYKILKSIDYNQFLIDVISVDDAYYDSRLIPLMEEKGFKLFKRVNQDLIFINKSFKKNHDNEKNTR